MSESAVMRGAALRRCAGRVDRAGRPLTDRELEVLAMMATGQGAKEAADALGLSVQTVKNHLDSAYAKLGATSLVDAFGRLGWLRVEPASETELERRISDLRRQIAELVAALDRIDSLTEHVA